MATALQRFYKDDSETSSRELKIFRACNEKVGKILRWSQNDSASLEELRELALSTGGLYNASMRQSAWLAMLGVLDLEEARRRIHDNLKLKVGEDDFELIKRDVGRSALFRYQAVTGSVAKGEHRSEDLKDKLASVLNAVISQPLSGTQGRPSYYQGLHDVASVLLFNLNFDEVKTTAVLKKLIERHLKDAVQNDFADVTALLDNILLPYIYTVDSEVYQALVESEVPLTSAILPWLITLFAHDLHDTAVISRIVDAFIASHPALPFYLSVAVSVHPAFRQEILDSACDPAMMHVTIRSLLSRLKNDFTIDSADEVVVTAQSVIESALALMDETPPENLLQLVGVGLTPRKRQGLVNKLRSISILDISPGAVSYHIQAQEFFKNLHIAGNKLEQRLKGVLKHVIELYGALESWASKVLVYSRGSLNAIQIVLLFILMPQHYMKEFVGLLRMASRLRCKELFLAIAGEHRTPTTSKGMKLLYESDDDDVPGMTESMSTISLAGVEKGIEST